MDRLSVSVVLAEISLATESDRARLFEVWETSVRATHHFLSEGDLQSLIPLVRVALAHVSPVYCVRDDRGEVCAFMAVDGAAIEMLFVAAAHRGAGAGRALVEHATRVLGARRVDVNEQNDQAVGFYEHLGFRRVARSPLDSQGNPFPILHMALAENRRGVAGSAFGSLTLSPDDVRDVVEVLADAFHDYPVMRYVLGTNGHYDGRLRQLVALFVGRRATSGDPMFGVRDDRGALVAAATVTPARLEMPTSSFLELENAAWVGLGADARGRYDAFSAAAKRFAIGAPNHYLDMIGVRRSHQGRGLARILLEAVHEHAAADERSTGVSLTTEQPANVQLYEHFGYRLRGHARVDDGLETWTLFREKPAAPRYP